MKPKKAQVLTLDFITGFIIFLLMLTLALNLIIGNAPSQTFDKLYKDNTFISRSLISPGYPSDWNETTVVVPGIVDNYRLNLSKLQRYDTTDYEATKVFFHTNANYAFAFSDANGILNLTSCVHGFDISVDSNCKPQTNTLNAENIVRTDRYIIYNSSIIQMTIYSWI